MNLRSARASAWLEVPDVGGLVRLGTVLLLDLVRLGVIGALNLLWNNLINSGLVDCKKILLNFVKLKISLSCVSSTSSAGHLTLAMSTMVGLSAPRRTRLSKLYLKIKTKALQHYTCNVYCSDARFLDLLAEMPGF